MSTEVVCTCRGCEVEVIPAEDIPAEVVLAEFDNLEGIKMEKE